MIKKLSVGSELDSYCGKCKMVLNHAVVAMVDDQPRRVRCLTCQSEHNHRLPSSSKPKSSRAKSSRRASGATSKSGRSSRWQTLMSGWDDAKAKAYSIYETFEAEDQVKHVKFGPGVVVDVPEPEKMIALFESGEKMLMQGKTR